MPCEEVFPYFNLSRSGGYAAVARGDIPAIRLGRKIVVPTAELRKLLGLDPDPQPASAEAATA